MNPEYVNPDNTFYRSGSDRFHNKRTSSINVSDHSGVDDDNQSTPYNYTIGLTRSASSPHDSTSTSNTTSTSDKSNN